ncbi:MAG: carboxypeptidase-like regulatory domain-containing protein, partial [Pyrinomonadaceae bacterium]
MYRKLFSTFFLVSAILLGGIATVIAQSAPVRGEVKLKKADGTMVPVADAVVDAYRMDVGKGSVPSSTTNKKGQFSFVGFPPGQLFALAVSAPGIGPRIEPNVKAGNDNIVILVDEGDGRKLTEAEVREVLASAVNIPKGEMSAAQKKEQEEFLKKRADLEAKNKRMQEGDEVASKANTEGIAALKVKNYDLAIAKFAEGVAAVPDFVGSTPVMLNGKMVSHKARGFDSYIEGARSADAAVRKSKYETANKDFDEGLAAFDQAMVVIKAAPAAPAATESADQKNRANVLLELHANALEVHRLKAVTGIDSTKTAQAAVVAEEYISLEPDPAKKTAAKVT